MQKQTLYFVVSEEEDHNQTKHTLSTIFDPSIGDPEKVPFSFKCLYKNTVKIKYEPYNSFLSVSSLRM